MFTRKRLSEMATAIEPTPKPCSTYSPRACHAATKPPRSVATRPQAKAMIWKAGDERPRTAASTIAKATKMPLSTKTPRRIDVGRRLPNGRPF